MVSCKEVTKGHPIVFPQEITPKYFIHLTCLSGSQSINLQYSRFILTEWWELKGLFLNLLMLFIFVETCQSLLCDLFKLLKLSITRIVISTHLIKFVIANNINVSSPRRPFVSRCPYHLRYILQVLTLASNSNHSACSR